MRFRLCTLAVVALVAQAPFAQAQFATLPQTGTPIAFSPPQCAALREIEGAVANRSADDIERIGAAMERNRYADPIEVARISGLSVPTVSTIGGLSQQDGMAVSLAFGSMLRHYHPALLTKVLRERGALGQVPDVADSPFGMALLDGLMNGAQQSYLGQCT